MNGNARRLASLVAIAGLGVFACGGGDDGSGPADASIDAAEPDAEVNTCEVLEASYGDLGAVTGTASYVPQFPKDEPDGDQVLRLQIPLNAESPPDVLVLELLENADPYQPDLMTGEVGIIDMQADIIACGACLYIAADFENPEMIDFHMASSGTISIDTLDLTPGTGSVTGSITGARLRKIELSPAGQQVVAGGCKTAVDAVSFDFGVTVPAAGARAIGPSTVSALRAQIN